MLIKTSDTRALHSALDRLGVFYNLLYTQSKTEIIKRLRKVRNAGEKPKEETDVGSITLITQDVFEIDEEKVLKFLAKKGIAESEAFNRKYVVVSENKTKLEKLEQQGILTSTIKVDNAKFTALATKHKQLLKYVEELDPKEYLRGL
jgi:hypothetical protein